MFAVEIISSTQSFGNLVREEKVNDSVTDADT